MSTKCPKCGYEGERVGPCVRAIMGPPELGYPFGKATYRTIHIIDSPDCLRRQLATMTERAEKAEADWRARAAEWLRDVAEVADAEGLTPPEIIEDRLKLADLLAAEAVKEKP